MGQYLGKPEYWHWNLLGAVQYNPQGCEGCGTTYVWDDRALAAFRFKDAEWKKGTALRNELEDFLDGAMEKAAGVVEQVPSCCTKLDAFCCGSCPDPKFVTIGRFTIGPELVEEFNKVCEENKNKKLLDMGLVCRAIYLRVRGQYGPTPYLLVLVEDKGDYYRGDPTEPVSPCPCM